MSVVFLLAVIAFLLYTHQCGRDYSLGLAFLIGALTWLAIEIHLLHIVADLFAAALEHWIEIVVALTATVVLIVPAIMIYIAVCDRIHDRRLRH